MDPLFFTTSLFESTSSAPSPPSTPAPPPFPEFALYHLFSSDSLPTWNNTGAFVLDPFDDPAFEQEEVMLNLHDIWTLDWMMVFV
tara:strand:+ start:197 stop:451 length:255 start_codon:yes stop_codon:yes gene_type:complete